MFSWILLEFIRQKNKLGEYMVTVAERTLQDVDVIVWLVEPSTFIGAGEQHIAEQLRKSNLPVILVINKTDTVKKKKYYCLLMRIAKSWILPRLFRHLHYTETIRIRSLI